MKDIAVYLLTNLVDQPDAVAVDEQTDETGNVTLTLTVAKDDMGKVIGRDGKIIRAIRDCIKILAVKKNIHVDVVLAE